MDLVSEVKSGNEVQKEAECQPIADADDEGNMTPVRDAQSDYTTESSVCSSEEDIPFEPFDINDDGMIIKTASRCSRKSWKRPEIGWDVIITVHRFCELSPTNSAKEDAQNGDRTPPPTLPVKQVEPDLQLELKLRKGEDEGFHSEVTDQATAAGVELHPLLHSGIKTMGRNERATFVVVAGDDAKTGGGDSAEPEPFRRLEYDISLDDWTEEVDLSERRDHSLVKRVIREGDGTTHPVDVGVVVVRCRVIRMSITNDSSGKGEEGPGDDTVIFDNLQSQDDPVDESEGLQGPLEFVLDDCPFGPGVMVIVKSMCRGEQCEAWLEPQYGPVDSLDDGQFYHYVLLELVEVEELPPTWEADEIRLEMSKRFKLEGNEKFAAGDFDRALRRYEKAIRYADGVPPGEASDGEETESDFSDRVKAEDGVEDKSGAEDANDADGGANAFVDLQVAVLCNQAACFLKMGDAAAALEVAERASTLKSPTDSPAGVKAAYRKACALEAVGDWDEARSAFVSVLDVDPKNAQCLQGLARLGRAKKAYQNRLRKAFGGCFASDKLKGFASEGREVPETPGLDGDPAFDGQGPMAEDGPWTDGSESETTSGDDEDADSEGTISAQEGERDEVVISADTESVPPPPIAADSEGTVSAQEGEIDEAVITADTESLPPPPIAEDNTASTAASPAPEVAMPTVAAAAAAGAVATTEAAPSSEPVAKESCGSPSPTAAVEGAEESAVVGTPSPPCSKEAPAGQIRKEGDVTASANQPEETDVATSSSPPPPPSREEIALKECPVSEIPQGDARGEVGV